jgi:hypothetical protein
MITQKEFGDFQTPESLATRAVALVSKLFDIPDVIIEPTVGLGTFLKVAAERWKDICTYEGYEINKDYVNAAKKQLSEHGVKIFHRDFFTENWKINLSRFPNARILILGNPPWVTNSDLGQFGSNNLPQKTNFQGLRGFDAKTGKANFDIAEWMLIRLIESLPPQACLAMLCKTMTARKVLRHFWKTDCGREGSRLFHINAKVEFDVAVDACLFFVTGKKSNERVATVYSDLDLSTKTSQFSFVDGNMVSDNVDYLDYRHLDGGSSIYTWRSGIKHDAAKVMEFTKKGNDLTNGYGESVKIEEDYVFPLLKSSDLGNGRVTIRKAVLVTQKHTGDDTSEIQEKAPKTWDYLLQHADVLDERKSLIYKNRPRFCVFGIGTYSFSPWKVAISGLYKNLSFVLIEPCNGRPVLVDDTCYSIPCRTKAEAELVIELLSSECATKFLNSLIFVDSKRPITIDVLRRLSFVELARNLGRLDELQQFVHSVSAEHNIKAQMTLLMEEKRKYRTKNHT